MAGLSKVGKPGSEPQKSVSKVERAAKPESYAENDVPQPQVPLALGLVNLKPPP